MHRVIPGSMQCAVAPCKPRYPQPGVGSLHAHMAAMPSTGSTESHTTLTVLSTAISQPCSHSRCGVSMCSHANPPSKPRASFPMSHAVLRPPPASALQSLPPREFPKVPIQLLEDVRPDGALYTVAARLAAIKRADLSIKAFEWLNPGQRRFNLENLQIIRADLIRAGFLKEPVIAAHPSCGVDGQKALEAAGKLQAKVVEDPGAGDAVMF